VWKVDLTVADLKADSPYNTYLHPGLPRADRQPGIDAIRAVANPARATTSIRGEGDGSHAFARTLEEHNANVAKYQKP